MCHSLSLSFALGAISLMAGGCSAEKKGQSFASPREVWDSYRHARDEGRWKDAFRCLTAEAQQRFIGSIIFSAAYLQGTTDRANAAKLKRILRKYGLDLEEIAAKAEGGGEVEYLESLIRGVKEKEGLFEEAMTIVHPRSRRPKGKKGKRVIALGELKSIEITEDRARGKCMKRLDDREIFEIGGVRQTEIEVKVEFQKSGGRWFVDSKGD